ncbi:MAG: hypothetical protein H6818_08030 [Phycisphaerales bacterium]|nr:hypothetical protein [Phycisphaerales bacterium]MCB9862521.1 hypothetical protein [Phycisphaerales bacterium]
MRASLITGPTHNLLGLEIRDNYGYGHAVEVIDLCRAEGAPTTVSAEDVKLWVLKAFDELDIPPQHKPVVTRIEYCRDDSRYPSAYERLVAIIVNHYISTK